MTTTTDLDAVFVYLKEDPCDWQRWAVYSDAVQELGGGPWEDLRDTATWLEAVFNAPENATGPLHPGCLTLADLFTQRRMERLPDAAWMRLQAHVAEQYPYLFWMRLVIGSHQTFLPSGSDLPALVHAPDEDKLRLIAEIVRRIGRFLRREPGSWSMHWYPSRRVRVRAERCSDGLIRFTCTSSSQSEETT
jgi:hypothetical protein